MSLPENNFGYPYSFSALKRQKIEGYLAWKWKIQDDLPDNHPYKYQQPTTTIDPTGVSSVDVDISPKTPASIDAGYIPNPISYIHVTDSAPAQVTSLNVYVPTELDFQLSTGVSLELLSVPPGTFTMGSPETEPGRENDLKTDETQHEVTLTQTFYLGKYEVTQAQYEAVMTGNTDGLSATPSHFSNDPSSPVEMVSWNDIQVFLTRLNSQQAGNIPTGYEFALPTEAQWEYACRAGTTTAYSFGDSITEAKAHYNDIYPIQYSEPVDVGQYDANPWGFFDMHGNVNEWVADAYAVYATSAQIDPHNAGTSGSSRVFRGGHYGEVDEADLRSAFRDYNLPSNKFRSLGFRVAISKKPWETESTYEAALTPTLNLEMLWVDPGTFTMGDNDVLGYSPEHPVTLTKGFYMGKYEVTQAQYEAVMTGNPNGLSPTPSDYSGNPNCPVEQVSWYDAQQFLARLNEQQSENIPEGWAYVLPTEAQWEYVCRAGSTAKYSWGSYIDSSKANYGNNVGHPTDVGSYPPNAWGFYDMHGNVNEWVADAYRGYTTDWVTDPFTLGDINSNAIFRGGSWVVSHVALNAAMRGTNNSRNFRYNIYGFRVALAEVRT